MTISNNGWRLVGRTLLLIALATAVGWIIHRYGESIGLVEAYKKLVAFLLIIAIGCIAFLVPQVLTQLRHQSEREQARADRVFPAAEGGLAQPEPVDSRIVKIHEHLRLQHSLFWRHNTRILLIIGEPTQIEAIAPGLAAKKWLVTQNALLLWGGSPQTDLVQPFKQWQGLSRWRALDGVVWALSNTQSANATAMATGVQHLQKLAGELHWQLPLHLWQVCDSQWPQPDRTTDPVGCLLPGRVTPAQLEEMLGALQAPLQEQGLAHMHTAPFHDFLFRLSRDLQVEGVARWRQALAPLLGTKTRGVPLRGLWFSLPLPPGRANDNNLWPAETPWLGVLNDTRLKGRRIGWNAPRLSHALMLGAAAVWGAGILISFTSNRTQILHVQSTLTTLQQPQTGDAQLLALNEWVRELARLDHRAANGTPWFQRFGLNWNDAVLDALWPQYIEANNRLMRDPAAASLERQLRAFVKLPAGSPERLERAAHTYELLKTYLMMCLPEKADPTFLAQSLAKAEPMREGLSDGVWQGLSPALWQFYTGQLAAHPEWRITPDAALVAQTRQLLLGQLSQRNAEATQYTNLLDAAAEQYPALYLAQMTGDTDAFALFTSNASVPGVFTRQAWEGQIRPAIDDIAQARREVIDWVLSDSPQTIATELTPDQLRQRLTDRYFEDYSSAWLSFLNSVRWRKADSLDEVIDQLTLMSDTRQSPLIKLMDTLAYQGRAELKSPALGTPLIDSAKQLIGQRQKMPEIDINGAPNISPLDATFGPILALTHQQPDGQNGENRLSLQTFLTRITQVRLKLQQISNAADPQGSTQALAQTVFQGKSLDLTDTRNYGNLIAASLGAEWAGIGQTLFVQPLEQAWQRVLQPSAAGLNDQWQRAIVSQWNNAFNTRYPFVANGSDASLPLLGQMIRADSGRIEQFLQKELSGVLRKEGNRWVADSAHSQGLRINPKFLVAINQLSQLADVVYTDGGMGLSFELSGKAVRDIVQTSFILNGQRHHYFNQKESWQRFGWPGTSDHPGASLSWTSVNAGERLFGDYQGTWGLIRLLETAQITPLDDGDSRYRIELKAPDGLNLTWHLRTELGAGPMALFVLRDFKLPQQIFLAANRATGPYAQNGSYE
ncbi:ImcF-related family protein [Pseudomonas huanghezhanensis]|uniref:ImcF-related family protein n=1 Tax=Pseudomonas huanghezhanensis TaxID=3002903 RepID=UPI002286B32C|nr:ImcF-related family protein [Pseudomonas sp. BSw22131]